MSQKIVNRIIRIGRKRGESRKHILAALATGRVESNFRNLRYGDADSRGWRQERASLYKNPNNLRASINRFYNEADRLDRGQKAGQLAADVQRPAAQYRGRYGQVMGEARQLLAGGGRPSGGTRIRIPGTPGSSEFLPGVDNSATRRQLKLDYLNTSHDPDALLTLAYGLKNARDVPSRTLRQPGSPGRFVYRSGKVAAPGKLQSIQAQADLLDAANNAGKLPYQWGGGHQGKIKRGTVTPVDCSGAVSAVLGINPRVASEFESWGKAGRGKRVTIWAKGDHVLMEINGRFFGTSHANPGGGAGWIPRKYLSKSYLSAFTPRHPPGL